jgi:CCR4-NOT transcriptional regulation complex NOT5 subunit
MNRPALVSLIIVLFLGCVVLTYFLVDCSISLSYSNQGNESTIRLVNNLESLIEHEWHGMSKDEVHKKLKEQQKSKISREAVIKIDGDIIWYDEIKFIFIEGKLSKIEN